MTPAATARAVILDIGGVLEITRATGWGARWEHRPGLPAGEINRRCAGAWAADLIAYVRSLRPRCRLGILSFVGAREREQHLLELVDDVVYSHEIGISKPDPRAFAAGCDRLRARPEDCLFIDDHPPNIDAARTFGMQAFLFTDNAAATAACEAFLRA
jgi:putative hydrolase of the HAD superfamily